MGTPSRSRGGWKERGYQGGFDIELLTFWGGPSGPCGHPGLEAGGWRGSRVCRRTSPRAPLPLGWAGSQRPPGTGASPGHGSAGIAGRSAPGGRGGKGSGPQRNPPWTPASWAPHTGRSLLSGDTWAAVLGSVFQFPRLHGTPGSSLSPDHCSDKTEGPLTTTPAQPHLLLLTFSRSSHFRKLLERQSSRGSSKASGPSPSFGRCANWGPERVLTLAKVTQLVRSRAEARAQTPEASPSIPSLLPHSLA